MITRRLLVSIAVLVAPASPRVTSAQQPATARDTLRLPALLNDALRRDPRDRQLSLLASQSALRQRVIDADRLPKLNANAQAQYQSDVVSIPFQLPNGVTVPRPAHDTYDAHVGAQQSIYDPGLEARHGVERAQLAASQARVRTSLFTLRQRVNDAYFSALLQQAQREELETAITDLEAQRQLAASRVRQGAALASEAQMLEAETIRRRQSVAELDADRDAALVVLSDLTGRTITAADALALPDLGADVTRARAALDTLRARPEYEQFARSRDVLAQQRLSLGAAELPRVSAFGRGGYGRPGLNPLTNSFEGYWLAGVQVDWSPWNWGTTNREREALVLQQQIVESDEAAFRDDVRRGVARDVANIDRLERTFAGDSAIIALRERILRETTARFSEGVITSAEYVDRQTDLLNARLARATHRIELAQARAHLLNSLGLEVH